MANIRKLKSQIRVLETKQKLLRRKIAKASSVVNVIDAKRAMLETRRAKAYSIVSTLSQKNSAVEAKINVLLAAVANGGKRPRNSSEPTAA